MNLYHQIKINALIVLVLVSPLPTSQEIIPIFIWSPIKCPYSPMKLSIPITASRWLQAWVPCILWNLESAWKGKCGSLEISPRGHLSADNAESRDICSNSRTKMTNVRNVFASISFIVRMIKLCFKMDGGDRARFPTWSLSVKISKKTVFPETQIVSKGVQRDTLVPYAKDVIYIINTGMQAMPKDLSHILAQIVMTSDLMFL